MVRIVCSIFFGISCLLSFSIDTLSAQWERYHKANIYSEGYFVTEAPDGGYFAVGINQGFGGPSNQRMYVVKTDDQGYLEWEKTLGDPGSQGYSGLITSDGNLLAVGRYEPPTGLGSMYLVKMNLAGTILWAKEYTAMFTFFDQAYSVAETNDGHFILGGDNRLMKTDTSGNVVWQKFPGDNRRDLMVAIDGNYIFTTLNGVIKTDTSGAVIWDYSSSNHIYTLEQTADSGVLACGLQTSLDAYYLMKLDKSGNLEWDSLYESGNAQALSYFFYGKPVTINKTSDGNYILCGTIEMPGSSANYCWLQKIDGNGKVLWKQTKLLSGANFYYHVEETSDKGFVICGEGYTSGNNVVILKTDSAGTFCSNEVLASPNPICLGDTTTLISLNTDPDFVWSFNGVIDSSVTGSVLVLDSLSNDLIVETFNNQCLTWSQTAVQVHRNYATISSSGAGSYVCQGGFIKLTASHAFSYQWSFGGTEQSYNVFSGGTYAVTVTNSCGMFDTSLTVIDTAGPVAMPPPDTTMCPGDTIQLRVGGGNSYLWTPGQYSANNDSAVGSIFPPYNYNIYAVVIDSNTACSTWTSVSITLSDDKCFPDIYTSNVTGMSARLNWRPFASCDDGFQIRGRNINSAAWITLDIAQGSPNYFDVFNLPTNQTFVWQMRAYCSPTDTNQVSDWSALDTFATIPCLAPDSIWTDTVTPTAVRLRWSAVAGAVGYQVRGGVLGSTAIVNLIISGPVTQYDVFNLVPGTSYVWQIKAFCSPSGTSSSGYSAIDTFETLVPKMSDASYQSVDEDLDHLIFFPNPFRDRLILKRSGRNIREKLRIQLFDQQGRLVFEESIPAGCVELFEDANLPAGIYHYRVLGTTTKSGHLVKLPY